MSRLKVVLIFSALIAGVLLSGAYAAVPLETMQAGHDKSFTAVADQETLWPPKITVVGDARLAGRKVTAMVGPQVLSVSVMRPDSGKSTANLPIPIVRIPKEQRPTDLVLETNGFWRGASLPAPQTVNLMVEGEGSVPVNIADAKALRTARQFLGDSSLVFSPFVFTGTAFPPCEFDNPSEVRRQIGDYKITCRFFNANYEEVTTADKPGRYGVVVKVTTSDGGPSAERYVTLFRQKDPIDWNNELQGTFELPVGMGIDPKVCKEQSGTVNHLFKWALFDSLSKSPAVAVTMAGLSEISRGTAPCTSRNGVQALDTHWWSGLLGKLNGNALYHYSTHLPKEYSTDSRKSWPLLIVLHGSMARAFTDEETWKLSVFTPLLNYTADRYPMITVIPHCPADRYWDPVVIKEMIDSLSRKYRVDQKRIYLTGYSMGGYGTFSTAVEYPDLFAAIAPISGGGDIEDAARLQHLPVRAFHGDADTTVSIEGSRAMIDAIRKAGGNAELTIYPGVDHDAVDPTFQSHALYEWLLGHSK